MEVMRRLRAGEEGDKLGTAAGEGVPMVTNTLPVVTQLIRTHKQFPNPAESEGC
jgi:hypothetical protein